MTNITLQNTNLKNIFRIGTIFIVSGVVLIIASSVIVSTMFYLCGPCHPMTPWVALAVFVSGAVALSGGIILQYRTEQQMKSA